MPGLPVSVRLALWVSGLLSDRGADPASAGPGSPVERAFARALDRAVEAAAPDLDHVVAPTQTLLSWRDLGERGVFVALPRPGDLTALPPGSAGREYADFLGAALEAGEALYAPSLGSALVPRFESYGPAGDRGDALRWSVYSCPVVPPVQVEAWSLRECERMLRMDVLDVGDALTDLASPQWASRELREELDDDARRGVWALPGWVPQRPRKAIIESARMAEIAGFALERMETTYSVTVHEEQRRAVRRLADSADRSLAMATNVAVASRAGWRPGRDD